MAFLLLQSIQQDFCVVEISLSEGDDSQEIFYSLNSQGQPLTQSDLLRSLIFMRAEKEKVDRDEIFNKYWSRFETEFWSSEVKRGGRAYSRLDLGLRYFLMAKTGKLVDARRVNEEYSNWIGTQTKAYQSVKDELADFLRYSDVYEYYETAIPRELPSTDLRRILFDFDVSTALPLLMFLELEAGLDERQKKDCFKTIESFIARRLLTGEETKEYNKLFVDVVASLLNLKGVAILPALQKKLLAGGGTTRHWPTNAEVIEQSISRQVFIEIKTSALRLILERLEIHFRNKKTENTEIPADLQIEHVMPKKWCTHWLICNVSISELEAHLPWLAKDNKDSIRSRNVAIHTLGNLTLLNKYLNPAVSNGSFAMKLDEYKNSVLRLNRYFDSVVSWDEEAIIKRGKLLGEAICEIWPRPDLKDDS